MFTGSLATLLLGFSTFICAMEMSGIEIKSFEIEKDVLESISTQKDFGAKNIYLNRRCKSHFGEEFRSSRIVSNDRIKHSEQSIFVKLRNSTLGFLGMAEQEAPKVKDVVYNVLCAKSTVPVEITDEQASEYLRMLEEQYEILNRHVQVNDASRKNGRTSGSLNVQESNGDSANIR